MTIGEIITKYCREHGMSYRQFAAKSGVTSGYISMLVHGANPKTGKPITVGLDKYNSFANTMGISIDELFSRMDDAPISISRAGDDDEDMWTLRENLRRDPNRRLLFSLAKNATQKDVAAAVALIDALRATNPDFYDGDEPS